MKANQLQPQLKEFLESKTVTVIMSLFTIYALFADDFRLCATKAEADPVFNYLTLIVLAGFIIEITLASIAVDDYFLSLYFWLDTLATVTMIMDVTWIWD